MAEANSGTGEELATDKPLDDAENDDLWGKVAQDRGAETVIEPPEGTPTPGAAAGAAVPESTQKLLDEIDRLKKAVEQQGVDIKTVGQHVSTINGMFGSMKQQVAKISPTIEAVEAERQAAEKRRAEEAAARRVELRERVAEIPDLVEYIDSVIPPQPAAEDKPATTATAAGAGAEETERLKQENEFLARAAELSDLVPGWRSVIREEGYQTWLKAQSDDVRRTAASSLDPKESATVLQQYFTHKTEAERVAQVERERQERLNRGANPQGRGTTGASGGGGGDPWEQVKRDREREKKAA